MTPTFVTACTALPPEGAVPPWGGPAVDLAPTLCTDVSSLPGAPALPDSAVSP